MVLFECRRLEVSKTRLCQACTKRRRPSFEEFILERTRSPWRLSCALIHQHQRRPTLGDALKELQYVETRTLGYKGHDNGTRNHAAVDGPELKQAHADASLRSALQRRPRARITVVTQASYTHVADRRAADE